MKAIFLVGAVQAFFLAILLVSKKNKITADYILSIWLIFTGIPLFVYFFNFENYYQILYHSENIPTYLMIINIPFLLLQSPFLFIYVSYVVIDTKKFKAIYLLHFLPTLLFIIANYFIIGFNIEQKETFDLYSYKYYQLILVFFPLTVILAFYYIIKSYLRIKKYKRKLYGQFSYTENIDFTWLKNLIIISSLVWIILLILASLFATSNIISQIHNIVLIAVSIAIFAIGYFGFLRTDVFIKQLSEKENTNEIIPKQEKKETNEQTILIIEKLKNFMILEKPYLESKLTIKQLADKLEIQAHQLSAIINENLNKNFFDFINEYRVEEVKNQIKNNSEYTLLGIAYECGFNSKSSFNRIFKKHTGKTPSEFQKIKIS